MKRFAFLVAASLCAIGVATPAAHRTGMVQTLKIVALGDSTTAGTPGFRSPLESPPDGSGDETSQFAYWLMQSHPKWVVLNRGVNGQRSDQIHARFDRDVVQNAP